MTDRPPSHVPVTEWAPLVPELTVSDLARSLSVYTELFGFTVHYTRPGFAYSSHGRAQLMLEQERAGDAWQTGPLERPYGRGINFQLEVPDVQAVLARLEAAGSPVQGSLRTASYFEGETEHRQREVLALDPDGSLWRFQDGGGPAPESEP